MADNLNGEVGYVFLVSILDAAVLSWIGLRWYRRSVSRLMRAPVGATDLVAIPASPDNLASPTNAVSIGINEASFADPSRKRSSLPPQSRRLGLAYLAGALAYACVMTAALARTVWPLPIAGVATFLWGFAWPVVPALGLLLALGRRRTSILLALFILTGSVLIAFVTLAGQIARGAFTTTPLTNVLSANLAWISLAWLPAGLLLVISWRRIRAVVATTLAATLFFGVALLLFRRAVVELLNMPSTRAVMLDLAVWTSSEAAYYSIYMLMALPVGLIVWWVMRGLAAAFDRKAYSDVQLVVDCWFAVVTMEVVATHLTTAYGVMGIAIGLGAFVAYRAGVETMLRVWPPIAAATLDGPPRRLLLLRVFGHTSRTESLFDAIAQRWRFRGPVQLIAGTDLTTRTVDPADVLAFVSGRLRDQYVASPDELPSRIDRLDMRPDRDGRFRVNELYCLHDTWKPALNLLLSVTDTVVMDLRGFSRESRGCVYELQQIVAAIPADSIVLLADRVTDRVSVEETLAQACARITSPVVAMSTRSISLVNVERLSARELDAVILRLLEGTGSRTTSASTSPPGR